MKFLAGIKKSMKNDALNIDFQDLYESGLDIYPKLHELGLKTQKMVKEDQVPGYFGGRVEVSLVNDEAIREINREYRQIDKPTDVISLSYFEDIAFPDDNLIGEIFISVDTALAQAKERGLDLEKEVIFLFVHGLLHIFGYDHETEAEESIMFGLQNEILS